MNPTPNSKTYRRELRAAVRSELGPNRSDPPDALPLLRATAAMAPLLQETTNARFELRVIDTRTGAAITAAQALQRAREDES